MALDRLRRIRYNKKDVGFSQKTTKKAAVLPPREKIMIKAVFFDIDGTLVPWKSGRIPASVFESVAALRRKGILCFVATGR